MTKFSTTAHAALADADKIAAEKADGTKGHFTGAIVRTGTVRNDSASAGQIGEFIESAVLVGSAVSLTTGNAADITSISLTAGDWDVEGVVTIVPASTVTRLSAWVSATSATPPTRPNSGGHVLYNLAFTSAATQQVALTRKRFSLAATTTVYLSTSCDFASTCTAHGHISARRVR